MAAENYHLKWDSHLSYLNSSVATLYKNEKFADVVLYSSSSISGGAAEACIPTVGISAHKFILSSCSQFFATMFETAPISAPNGGVLYVVLPPDLSHRAIQILVQYMYSGEATVANDILSEVLRGGEILKIRGLCRTPSTSSHHNHHQREPNATNSAATHYGASGGGARAPLPPNVQHTQLPNSHVNELYATQKCAPSGSGGCGTRYGIEPPSHSQSQQFRGLGASVMPKDSPVIVKSAKMSQMALLPPGNKHHTGGGISVNKEVAIDPEEKCCYQMGHAQEALPVGASLCSEVGCSSCPMPDETEQLRRGQRQCSQGDDMATSSRMPATECDYEEQQPDEHDEEHVSYERRLRRESGNEHVHDYFVPEHYEHSSMTNTKQFVESVGPRLAEQSPPTPPLPHNFLAIKQEPTDWSASSALEASSDLLNRPSTPMLHSPKQPLDFKMPLGGAAVKLEAGTTHSADEEEPGGSGGEYDHFTRLVCEVCKKSFDEPKAWVRHLETHASTASNQMPAVAAGAIATTTANGGGASGGVETLAKAYVPKKRRRVSQQENNMDHVTLLCDLCSTSFETPAEWVRHMNNQHTEIELAMFNSKKDSEQKTGSSSSSSNNNNTNSSVASVAPTASSSQGNHHNHHHHHHHQSHKHKYNTANRTSLGYAASEPHAERICDICHKKFSSHSNMLLHKRSHTSVVNSNASSLSSSPVPVAATGGCGGVGSGAQSQEQLNNSTPSQA